MKLESEIRKENAEISKLINELLKKIKEKMSNS